MQRFGVCDSMMNCMCHHFALCSWNWSTCWACMCACCCLSCAFCRCSFQMWGWKPITKTCCVLCLNLLLSKWRLRTLAPAALMVTFPEVVERRRASEPPKIHCTDVYIYNENHVTLRTLALVNETCMFNLFQTLYVDSWYISYIMIIYDNLPSSTLRLLNGGNPLWTNRWVKVGGREPTSKSPLMVSCVARQLLLVKS